MAVNSTYYLDAADLSLATAVYLDSALSLIAPDGFYADGVISRQQSLGILLTANTCPTCAFPCGGTINGSGNEGIYLLNLDSGSTPSSIGAIVVRFDPFGYPDGIRAVYDGNTYNTLSSPIDGLHKSTNPLGFTIVGNASSTGTCSPSWYPSGGSILLDEYLYSGGSFTLTGNSQTIAIASSDISLSAADPGFCVMVIPKVTASPNIINFEFLGPCGGTRFDIIVSCPELLPSFQSSTVQPSSSVGCSEPFTETYYFAKVHTAVDTFVGLYDYVFVDEYGATPLADGFYLISNVAAPNKVIEVVNGIVVAFTDCGLPVTGLTWDTTVNNPCDAAPWLITNSNLKIRYNITDSQDCGGTCDSIQSGTATATITVGGLDVNMGLSFEGIGELQAAQFEQITFFLDGVEIANANAAGGNLGCQMGPVVQNFIQAPPYFLLANSVHTLFINFTTNDELYHVGAYYEVDLTFAEIP